MALQQHMPEQKPHSWRREIINNYCGTTSLCCQSYRSCLNIALRLLRDYWYSQVLLLLSNNMLPVAHSKWVNDANDQKLHQLWYCQ